MNTLIKPTVGRKVWFRPNTAFAIDGQPLNVFDDQPLDATIICVWGDRMVNLSVTDHAGTVHTPRSVNLLQDGDSTPTSGYYCEWMPYQTKQAAKEEDTTEAVEEDDGSKVTLQGILAKIVDVSYTVLPDCRTTVCQLTMENGYTVNGYSAVVDIANFEAALGQQFAFNDAVRQVWPLEGYLLTQQNYEDSQYDDEEDSELELTAHIAFACHEVNRAYCQALGDFSQPAWQDAPIWQIESALKGVQLHMAGDFGPEASHESWMAEKLADGWGYGEVKNADAKTHPCLLPFHLLPKEQQAKDFIFRAVVHALTAIIAEVDDEEEDLSYDDTGSAF